MSMEQNSLGFEFGDFIRKMDALISHASHSAKLTRRFIMLAPSSPGPPGHPHLTGHRGPRCWEWADFRLSSYITQICQKHSAEPAVEPTPVDQSANMQSLLKRLDLDLAKFRRDNAKNERVAALSDSDLLRRVVFLKVLGDELATLDEASRDFLIRFVNSRQIMFQFLKSRLRFLVRLLRGRRPVECLSSLVDSDFEVGEALERVYRGFCKRDCRLFASDQSQERVR